MVKKFLSLANIINVILIIGAIYVSKLVNNSYFEGIIYIYSFFSIAFIYSFIYSFTYKKFKDRLIGGFVTLFSVLILILLRYEKSDSLIEYIFLTFVFYVIPAIIIATLSQFLTFLWRKIRK